MMKETKEGQKFALEVLYQLSKCGTDAQALTSVIEFLTKNYELNNDVILDYVRRRIAEEI